MLFIYYRVFVADTLNFSFFSDDESKKFTVNYKGKDYTGYWSWIAAFNKALDVSVVSTVKAIFVPGSQNRYLQLISEKFFKKYLF